MANIIASFEQELQARLIALFLANGLAKRCQLTDGEVDGYTTWFHSEDRGAALIAELVAMEKNNGNMNPFTLSGKNLWSDAFISQYKENYCNTDGLVTRQGPIPIHFDLENLDVAAGDLTVLLVDAGSYGYFIVTDYHNDVPSPFVSGGI